MSELLIRQVENGYDINNPVSLGSFIANWAANKSKERSNNGEK